eukprot:gene14559-17205_t
MEHMVWLFDRIGTYFIFTEWIFIGCYWTQLLYTFFVSSNIILKNSRRAWNTSWGCALTFALFNIVTVTLGMIDKRMIKRWYAYGNIFFYLLYGFAILINGIVLVRFMKSVQNRGVPHIEKSIAKINRLAAMLGILVIGAVIIQLSVTTLPVNSYWRYLASVFFMGLEFSQAYIVLAALGGNSIRNYFRLRRVDDNGSNTSGTNNNSNNKTSGGGSAGAGSAGTGGAVGTEFAISLKEITNSSGLDDSGDSNNQRPQSIILPSISISSQEFNDQQDDSV